MLLGLLGAPLALIVFYPEQAKYFTEFAATMIPWGVVLLLFAIFSDGIKKLLFKIVEAIGRLKSISAGVAAVELNAQGLKSSELSPEQIQALRTHMQELSTQNQDVTNLASHFFLKYVGATIYGSQFRLLEALETNPLTPNQAVSFYNQFVASAPKDTDYPFSHWAAYLTDNFLLQFDANSGQYQITQAGQNFLNQAKAANLNADNFLH